MQKSFGIVCGAEKGTMLAVAGIGNYSWLVVVMMPADQRCTQGSAGIARRRLDPDFLEWAFSQDPSVTDTIESNATGEAEVAFPCQFVRPPRYPQHDFFRHGLKRASDIHVPLRQLGFRLSRRTTEQTTERAIRHPEAGHEIEVASVKPE